MGATVRENLEAVVHLFVEVYLKGIRKAIYPLVAQSVHLFEMTASTLQHNNNKQLGSVISSVHLHAQDIYLYYNRWKSILFIYVLGSFVYKTLDLSQVTVDGYVVDKTPAKQSKHVGFFLVMGFW